jgi:2-oxo-hept-3-ene-1,7-dioate hydratase
VRHYGCDCGQCGLGRRLGRRQAVPPLPVDIRWICATLAKDGAIEESGVASVNMGHPAAGVAWLANRLSAVGERLKRWQFLLGGSFTQPVDTVPGDVIHADCGPFGGIDVAFA